MEAGIQAGRILLNERWNAWHNAQQCTIRNGIMRGNRFQLLHGSKIATMLSSRDQANSKSHSPMKSVSSKDYLRFALADARTRCFFIYSFKHVELSCRPLVRLSWLVSLFLLDRLDCSISGDSLLPMQKYICKPIYLACLVRCATHSKYLMHCLSCVPVNMPS